MDFIYIALILFVIFLIAFFKSSTGKGIIGEFIVKLFLGSNKPNEKYIINNLMIVHEGKSSQIDHLMIKQTGIFVIETKNYSGRIYGQENQHEWTQVLNYGKVKNKFYNPILQNRTHIYSLSKVIGRNDCFFSIVVFLKAQLMNRGIPNVGYVNEIHKVYKSQTKIIFSIEEMNQIHQQLLDIKNNPAVSLKQHVKDIKLMQSNIENNICPRCGKPLVIRKGKYGDFYGCSGYPDCKFKTSRQIFHFVLKV